MHKHISDTRFLWILYMSQSQSGNLFVFSLCCTYNGYAGSEKLPYCHRSTKKPVDVQKKSVQILFIMEHKVIMSVAPDTLGKPLMTNTQLLPAHSIGVYMPFCALFSVWIPSWMLLHLFLPANSSIQPVFDKSQKANKWKSNAKFRKQCNVPMLHLQMHRDSACQSEKSRNVSKWK